MPVQILAKDTVVEKDTIHVHKSDHDHIIKLRLIICCISNYSDMIEMFEFHSIVPLEANLDQMFEEHILEKVN